MREESEFTGTIGKMTPDGACAVVRLDPLVGRFSLAVINFETQGRLALREHGAFHEGAVVTGYAVPGPDAMKVVVVAPAAPAVQ